jgi:hypothetical protein
MAIMEHDQAVTRVFKSPPNHEEDLIRPVVNAKNPYLNGAADFTPMLHGVVE